MIPFGNHLQILLCAQDSLNLNNVDISTVFNHYLILIYYAIPSVKEISSIGYHTDITFDSNDNYLPSQKNQRTNTSMVVYTLGNESTLYWKWKLRYMKWVADRASKKQSILFKK